MTDVPSNLSDPSGFIAHIGLYFDTVSGVLVTGHLDVTPEHHTPWGVVHGGVYASMIESAASLGASIAVLEEGRYAVGVNNQTDFLRPHRLGRLDLRATPVQQGRTLQLWVVDITNADDRTVARGQVRLFNQALAAGDGPNGRVP
ncbi:MAG: PaaI family thioesterase [Acidimicrobiaceae bacterium]|nr:PaaI family thioesterase [Acidimicrobiaceae bacterium]